MKYLAISEFCITSSGGTPSRSITSYYENGTIPWIKSGELKKRVVKECEEYITQEAIEKSSAKLVPAGSILLAMYGATVGEVAELGIEAATNQAICHIIPNKEICDKDYLFYFFKSIKSSLIAKSVGGGQPNISQAIVRAIKVPLPPLQEQRRIAAILDKAEALRAKRREAIAKLDQLLQSIFIDIFGDPISNPKKFNFLPISKIISRDTINGAYYPKDKYVDNGGTPMVHMSDAFYDTVSTTGLKQVDISKYEVEKYLIDDSDILIARRSLVYEGAAKPCRPKTNGKDMIFESSFIRVTPDKSIIDTTYLFHYLKNTCVRKNFILKFITKSTISGINQKNLNMIEVMIPDIERQNKFRLIEKKINEKKIILEKQNFIFDNFLKSLTQLFFK